MGEIGRAPFILGVLIFAAGVLWAVNQWHFRGSAVRAEGQVVDVVVEITTKQTRLFYPVVEFTSAGGEQVRFKERVGITGSPLFDKGESVPVLYPPGDPSQAQIDSFSTSWLGPLLAGAFGLMLVGVGLLTGR